MMASLKLMQMKLVNITTAIRENGESLSNQVAAIDTVIQNYAQTHAAEALPPLLQAVRKVHRISDILNKSIARFRL